MRVGLASVAVMLAVAAAGCGGGGSGGSSGYSLPATRTCLQKAGFEAAALGNDELPGTGGNLRVKLTNKIGLLDPAAPSGGGPENEYVFLVFAKDPAKAREFTENAPGSAAKGTGPAEMAAWTAVGNVLLNLDETLMKR